MYFSDLGVIALILALVFSLYTVVASVAGAVRSARPLVASAQRSTIAVFIFLLLASVALVVSFLTHDFGVNYVAQHSSLAMPWYYVTAAFYSGQEGSLLYWALMLALFSAIFVCTARRVPAQLLPYILATVMGIEAFFCIVLTTATNPFIRTSVVPKDGLGLNPLLLDPGMLVHPPVLLLGYMSFSLPFAFAIAALITGRLNAEWLRLIRRWMLAAWSLQTMGLLLGAWWAYHVLGWGGYWSWDPVENVALMPWLTATAFLHSTMVQERRGMLKVWNLFLVIATFALSIFGTFEARSGLINSVHSFAYSNASVYYLVFLGVIIAFSSALFLLRMNKMQAEQEFDTVVSREGIFLLNNLLLVGVTFATLWGTLFPLISQALRGETIAVNAPFYNEVNGPLLIVLVLAMGIGPLLAWRRTSLPALWRNLSLPAVLAAVCATVLPFVGVTNIAANVGFSVCTFTAGAILYELWRGARVRHRHGEPFGMAVAMLFLRYRRRYGGYIVHLGMVLLTVGIIGSSYFQQQNDAALKPGQEMSVGGYRFVYQGNITMKNSDNESVSAQVQIWHDGRLQRYAYPGRTVYTNYQDQPTSQIEIIRFGLTDVYLFLADWNGASQATIRVFLNPLVTLVWYGGVLMFLGGIFCWWPERRLRVETRKVVADNVPVPSAVNASGEVTVQ